ncbi:SusC/RagA family protein [Niastella vici]|uniref:SusC/RagA family protein n=1 Tax=Niastella vici TaxID=1703345 RepID=A0A1V9G081_9BACT|nr:TonB-dependent receptor [Niastella vici]OQP63987.1 SusC/RagA family protein [Niastella vici]
MKLFSGRSMLIAFILLPVFITAQTINKPVINSIVTGKVTDGNAPLEGTTVQIKGTTNTATTDFEGNFTLKTGQKLPFTLVVTYIGYQKEEVLATGAHVDVLLHASKNKLDEVVVVGYGTQRKKDLTGSVASVSRENLSRPASSLDNLLQGAVAGVVVNQSSGQPGATATIRIRGGNSLSFGNDPLYVIDGFIYYNDNSLTNLAPASGTVPAVTGVSTNGLSTINPSDIESIDVLKDAAATAIYGSRGANGVVIVTTKRGTKGSNNISFNSSYGQQYKTKLIPVLNGQQWAKLFDDLYHATPTIQAGLAANKKLIDSAGAAGVNGNWTEAAIRTGAVQNHQLTLFGGDDKSRYSVSGNYFNQKGIVLASDFKRYSARVNYEKEYSKKLKLATSIFGSSSSENKLPGATYNGIGFSNAFSSLSLANPLQTVKNADGSYNTTAQPAINPTLNTISGQQFSDNAILGIAVTINQTKLSRVLGNFSAEYKITSELVAKSTIGADLLNTKLNYYTPSYTNSGNLGGTITGSGSVGTINYISWLNENTLTYDHAFEDKHFLNLLVGYTTQYQKSENTFLAGQTFSSDATTYNNLYNASANKVIGSAEAKQTRNSWLGRISYSLLHRYNLTLAARADGASPAGANKKWGLFPSVGFSWNVSDEDFFKRFDKTINNLKLRLTYGRVGNANFPAYSSLATITSYGYYLGNPLTGTNGLAPSQLSNPDLTWETTTQYNAGIDLGLLKNRIVITADAYYKKTTNLYVSGSGLVPLSSGYASVSENIGSLENKGVELTINTDNIKSKNFTWRSTLIYARNANKVLSLGPSESFFPVAPTGQVSPVIVKVGLPVGTFWGYNTAGLLTTADVYGAKKAPILAGVSQVTGDRKYVDSDGDGVVTTADKHNLGNAQPKFTASFSNTITWKNLDLSVFFQGSFGNKIFNLLQQQLEKTTTTQNVSTVLLDRWDSVSNPNGKFPKVVNAPVVQVADTYIEDGSYIRLKNITLGYNFPKDLAAKILAKQIRIYGSVTNLLTITKYKGLDPEANFYDQNNLQPGIDYGVYPNYRTYTLGINVTF